MNTLTTEMLRELLALGDEIGVLTVSVGFDPSDFADGPTGPNEVRAQLRQLARDSAHSEAVQARIDALQGRIEALLDPSGDGRGRYLVAAIGGDQIIEHRLEVPLPAMAALDDGPVLRHLLEALDEHQPAGALLLHTNEAHLLEVGFAGSKDIREWSYRVGEMVLADETSGPGPSGSTVAPGGVTHKDQQEDRVQANRDRFLRDVAADVRRELAEHDLNRVVLIGPAHERQIIRDGIGTDTAVRVLDVDHTVASDDLRPAIDAAQLALSRQHAAYERELVDDVRDRAGADGRGAVGAEAVVDALTEGRVQHLLLAPDLELHGWVGEDGLLLLDEDDPRTAAATPERRLVHRMIERTLDTDGDITPVDAAAAAQLAEVGGVAALLRW